MSDGFVAVPGCVVVLPAGESVNGERATLVKIADEGDGAFVEVEQSGRDCSMTIGITREEWPALRRAINKMMRVAEMLR